jgi:hypothetical protein
MNRLSIILPAASITLGSLFLYIGFESGTGGYVTLSIDGAFLFLVGLVSIFAPRADTAEVEFIAALSRQLQGASEYFPKIMKGEVSAHFTVDGKVNMVDLGRDVGDKTTPIQVLDPLDTEFRKAISRLRAGYHNHRDAFPLTKKFKELLIDKGLLEDIQVEFDGRFVVIKLYRPIAGIPLLLEYRNTMEATVATLSSKLLATVCCLVSADIDKNTVVDSMSRDGDYIIIKLTAL